MRMHLRMIDDRTGFSAINKVRTLGCGLLSWFKGFLSDERVKSAVPKTSFECDFAERQDLFLCLLLHLVISNKNSSNFYAMTSNRICALCL